MGRRPNIMRTPSRSTRRRVGRVLPKNSKSQHVAKVGCADPQIGDGKHERPRGNGRHEIALLHDAQNEPDYGYSLSEATTTTKPGWDWCSEASDHSCGCKSRRQKESREAVVVISNNGKGDRPVESLDVKAPVDRGAIRSDPTGGRATWQAVADANRKATKTSSRVKRIAGFLGAPSRSTLGEGPCRHRGTGQSDTELPGVEEDGMPRRNDSQSSEPLVGRLCAPRTAKASRISRFAVKLGCAREWGGWGRLSVKDRTAKPDRSEGPWGGGQTPSMAV